MVAQDKTVASHASLLAKAEAELTNVTQRVQQLRA
jgi:hypothetical protein